MNLGRLTGTVNFGKCPRCGDAAPIRPKLALVEAEWVEAPDENLRPESCADVPSDAIRREQARARPLEQFIDANFCEECGHTFTLEEALER